MAETSAFLKLKWCTCDCLDDVRITSNGVENEKPLYWLDVIVPTSAYWLARSLRTTRLSLPLPGAGERLLALVQVEPAPDATDTGYRLYQSPKPEPQAQPEPSGYGPAPWLNLLNSNWLEVAHYLQTCRPIF